MLRLTADSARGMPDRFILVDESYRIRFFNPKNVNVHPLRCLKTERCSRCVIFAGHKAVGP